MRWAFCGALQSVSGTPVVSARGPSFRDKRRAGQSRSRPGSTTASSETAESNAASARMRPTASSAAGARCGLKGLRCCGLREPQASGGTRLLEGEKQCTIGRGDGRASAVLLL